MATSVKTPSPSPAVTGLRRAALTGYRWLLPGLPAARRCPDLPGRPGRIQARPSGCLSRRRVRTAPCTAHDYSGSRLDAALTLLASRFGQVSPITVSLQSHSLVMTTSDRI